MAWYNASTNIEVKTFVDADFSQDGVADFKGTFMLKMQTYLSASPDELLKYLSDASIRPLWDLNVKDSRTNDQNELVINYMNSNPLSLAGMIEKVIFKYMVQDNKFYIIEYASSPVLGKYNRAWILEQVVNRPNTMRINYLAEVK